MRKRTKSCFECKELNDVMYRCRYGKKKNWGFLCKNFLGLVKENYQRDYQYGGTWKRKKK